MSVVVTWKYTLFLSSFSETSPCQSPIYMCSVSRVIGKCNFKIVEEEMCERGDWDVFYFFLNSEDSGRIVISRIINSSTSLFIYAF